MNWKDIRKLYENAVTCFKCPKGVKEWMRDVENGFYYLYGALREARSMTEIDHLAYARILALLADVTRPKDYGCFICYIKPAYEQLRLAMSEDGEQPTESEARHIEKMFLRAQYEAEHWDEAPESYRKAISLIVNSDLLDKHKVDFYDSRLVSFHVRDNHTAATLELEYDGKVMKLAFENLMEYEISSGYACPTTTTTEASAAATPTGRRSSSSCWTARPARSISSSATRWTA